MGFARPGGGRNWSFNAPHWASRTARKAFGSAWSKALRLTNTTSKPSRIREWHLKLSRAIRLMRFLRTAEPTCFRAMANPRRGGKRAPRFRARTVIYAFEILQPFRKTRSMSRARDKRMARPDRLRTRLSVNASGAQASPALSAPCFDDSPARARSHARAKSMPALSFQPAGLIGSLHLVAPDQLVGPDLVAGHTGEKRGCYVGAWRLSNAQLTVACK